MRWESLYEPTAGESDEVIKYVRFDPLKGELEMHNEGIAKERWAVPELERFVAEGQGNLTATELKPRNPHRRIRLTLQLVGDHLSYEWSTSPDGMSYSTLTKVRVERAGERTGLNCTLGQDPLPDQ